MLRPALGRIGTAMDRVDERRVLGLLAASRPGAVRRSADFAAPASGTALRAPGRRELRASGSARRRGTDCRPHADIGPPPSIRADLARVRGADVFLIFIESYGAVSYDRPEFAAELASSRARLDADIQATGRDVVSTFVESPTFGGNSWLAHVSLLSGVEVRDEDTNVQLMAQKRDTMVTAFAPPRLSNAWPSCPACTRAGRKARSTASTKSTTRIGSTTAGRRSAGGVCPISS